MALGTYSAQQVIDEFISQWGFDVSASEALAWLKPRYRTIVRRSRCDVYTGNAGVTVAGQSDYVLDVVELFEVTVGGVPYHKAPHRSQVDALRGRLRWTPRDDGLYVVSANSLGNLTLGLIPTPDTSGLAIRVFAAYPAATNILALSTVLHIDDAFVPTLQEGMAATGYARDAEQMAAADRCEARFDAGCEEYRRDVKRRMRSGPAQIRIR